MRNGFSLIEVLLSIALIGILAGLSLPVYTGYVTRNDTQIAAVTLAQAYRHAQSLARSGKHDTAWGVHGENGSITVFTGSDYTTRNTDYDEKTEISSAIGFSGTDTVIFEKFTGTPDTTANVTLSSVQGGTKTVSLNEKGMVQQ